MAERCSTLARMAESRRVTLDLTGTLVTLSAAAAVELRDAAAADAGRSSARRDLSLILERALTTNATVALRRAEARELADILAEHHLGGRFAELGQALAAAREPPADGSASGKPRRPAG